MRMKFLFIIYNTIIPLSIGTLVYYYENTSTVIRCVANYLPDALWSYSLVSLMLIVWKLRIPYSWVISIILLFAFTELLQFLDIIPGTGDLIDIFIYTLSGYLSFLILSSRFINKVYK